MKIGVYINESKKIEKVVIDNFLEELKDLGNETVVFTQKIEYQKKLDLLVVFGGDGTILSTVNYACTFDCPILAINTGNIGFLTTFEIKDIDKAIELIKNRSYTYSYKNLLSCEVNGNNYLALNDIVLERNNNEEHRNSEVISLKLSIDGQEVDKIKSDGLVISTPTGSTAYSLSAGGSILSPSIQGLIATPICAHSLHSRPIVYNDDSIAKIELLKCNSNCSIYVDGKFGSTVVVGDVITVKKHDKKIKLIDNGINFYKRLLSKLNTWGN